MVIGGAQMYAIIETGGKQYKVEAGDTLYIEKLNVEEGSTIEFDKVLAVANEDGLTIGSPLVESAKVSATVVENGKLRKVIIYKFKAKKDYRKKQGHRQPFTKVTIESISL